MPKVSLVTGASGFVGANLVRRLLKNNHEVHVILRKDTQNLWRLNEILGKITIHYGDILDYGIIKKIFSDYKPSYVFNLATYGAYPRHESDENKMINVNCLGTLNLLKAVKDEDIKKFVNTGSSSEYGIRNKPMAETDRENPLSMYAVTKLLSTNLMKVYSDIYGIPAITLRLFSVYGYYEDYRRLIPYIIKSSIFGSRAVLNNPNFVRDFIFIDDVCDAYIKATKFGGKGEVFNIGSGVESKISDVADIIRKLTGFDKIDWKNAMDSDEPRRWVCDTRKSRSILKFKAKTSLKNGLKLTYDWMKKNIDYYGK